MAWQQERSKLQTAVQAAQQRLQDLEKVNAQLQVHLDTHARAAAGQAPDEGTILAAPGSPAKVQTHTLHTPTLQEAQATASRVWTLLAMPF